MAVGCTWTDTVSGRTSLTRVLNGVLMGFPHESFICESPNTIRGLGLPLAARKGATHTTDNHPNGLRGHAAWNGSVSK